MGVRLRSGKKVISEDSSDSDESDENSDVTIINANFNKDVSYIKSTKPICVNASFEVVKNLCQVLSLNIKPTFKIKGKQSTHIFCDSIEDKKTIIKRLKERKIEFHSFSESTEISKSFVLRGYHDNDVMDVLKELKSAGLAVKKVSVMFKQGSGTQKKVQKSEKKVPKK